MFGFSSFINFDKSTLYFRFYQKFIQEWANKESRWSNERMQSIVKINKWLFPIVGQVLSTGWHWLSHISIINQIECVLIRHHFWAQLINFAAYSTPSRLPIHSPINRRYTLSSVGMEVSLACIAQPHIHVCAWSCPTLCDPVNCSLSGSSVHGIFQARILEQVAIFYSRGSSQPGIEPVSLASPALAGRFFTTSTTWEEKQPHICIKLIFCQATSTTP